MSLLSRRTLLALLLLSFLPLVGRVRAEDEKIRVACVGDSITFGCLGRERSPGERVSGRARQTASGEKYRVAESSASAAPRC